MSHEGEYTTDILSRKAKGFLRTAVEAEEPFFLAIASVAPHSNVVVHGGNLVGPEASFTVTPPVAAQRHRHLFSNVKIPRTEHFNPQEVLYPLYHVLNTRLTHVRLAVSIGLVTYPVNPMHK